KSAWLPRVPVSLVPYFVLFSRRRVCRLLPLNPFPDVRRTINKLYTASFVVSEKANNLNIYERDFGVVQLKRCLNARNQGFQIPEVLGLDPSNQPENGRVSFKDFFDLEHRVEKLLGRSPQLTGQQNYK